MVLMSVDDEISEGVLSISDAELYVFFPRMFVACIN